MMRRNNQALVGVAVGLMLVASVLCARAVSAQVPFTGAMPVSVTSCGQSPDAYTVSMLLKRAKLDHTFENMLKPEGLKGLGTLVVVMGGSAKGLGEAGIDEAGELKRVAALLTEARKLKIKIVAAHVGGESRRGPLSDKFITPVVAQADYVIVTAEGNKDGAFNKMTAARKTPLNVVKQLTDVGPALRALFPAK
jgi:hypothetical protein